MLAGSHLVGRGDRLQCHIVPDRLQSMNHLTRVLALGSLLLSLSAQAQTAGDGDTDAVLSRIRVAAMKDDWAYQRLADLCDKIGPRLSGTAQADAAVAQLAAALKAEGLQVTLQPAKVPHWERGE